MPKLNMILAAFLVFAFAFLLVAAYLAKPLMFEGGSWAEAWHKDRQQHSPQEHQRLASLQ